LWAFSISAQNPWLRDKMVRMGAETSFDDVIPPVPTVLLFPLPVAWSPKHFLFYYCLQNTWDQRVPLLIDFSVKSMRGFQEFLNKWKSVQNSPAITFQNYDTIFRSSISLGSGRFPALLHCQRRRAVRKVFNWLTSSSVKFARWKLSSPIVSFRKSFIATLKTLDILTCVIFLLLTDIYWYPRPPFFRNK